MRNILKPMAKGIGTAKPTTAHGIVVEKGQPTTRRSMPCGTGNDVTFSQHFFLVRAYRCCPQATSSVERNPVTTMPIVRTIRSAGYLGNVTHARSRYLPLLASYWPFDGLIQSFA